MKSKISLIVLALTALVLPLQAAKPGAGARKHKQEAHAGFKKKDADHNGFLTKEEFAAGGKVGPKREKIFVRKDKNGDGKLSRKEFNAGGKKKHGKGRHAHAKGGKKKQKG
ncbi:EF-hand domain-containing protein [Haloferula sp. BvORR071]|uniref:EF-hand domain-containing protein n=1 Tax=Haloferula sp. BvORR071 TaxID=1396141 RepID=UPI000556C269|nr:EF-hand domain-containing protein [Haloferula sp. BvORR071]